MQFLCLADGKKDMEESTRPMSRMFVPIKIASPKETKALKCREAQMKPTAAMLSPVLP